MTERRRADRGALARLLDPGSIALVGVTENSLWSRSLVTNLTALGYQGSVYLVNPKYKEQFGMPCWPSVRAIPGPVDSAYIMTGTGTVESVIEDCTAKGITSVTVLTSGYKEVGPEGEAREDRLVRQCRAHGITMLGPNCLGFISFRSRVVAYALPITEPLVAGRIAVVSQSGAMLQHIQRYAQQRNIGLSYLVSIGNEAMLDAVDFLRHFLEDPGTTVLAALLEGIRDPEGFLQVARGALEAGKPLVVLKAGRSQAGARVARAHTGALAGSWAVLSAVFRQWGVVAVDSIEEMLETAALLAEHGWPAGRRTAVVAPSGGACGLIGDLAEPTRIEMPDFTPQTKERLAEILPSFGTAQNPLDTTGYVVLDGSLLARTAEVAAQDRQMDCLLIVSDPPRDPGPAAERAEQRLRLLSETLGRLNKFAFVVTSVMGELTPCGRQVAMRCGLHFGNGLPLSIRALDRAITYGELRRRALQRLRRTAAAEREESEGKNAGVRRKLAGRRGALSEWESKEVLASYGIPLPREALATTATEAAAIAREIGFPVVLKIQSADILHKTEVGGVKLGLRDEEEVRRAFQALVQAVQAHDQRARIDGVLVAQHLEPVAELIAGVVVDAQFGPVVLVGSGGILAEVIGDVTMGLPPLDHDEAAEMLAELRAYRVLQGVRGRPAGDLEAAADCLVRLGNLAVDLGDQLAELDINPLFVMPRGQGVVAADALLVCRER